MNYKFLSTLIPRQMYGEVAENSRHNMQDAANALQWHIYEGLCANLKKPVQLINVLPIGSFPQYYKKPFVHTEKFTTENCPDNINAGFCNVKLIRRYIQPHRIYRELKKAFKNEEDGVLLVYSASDIFMKAIEKFKRGHKHVRICTVIADLPDMCCLSSDYGIIKRIYFNHLAAKAYDRLKYSDGFVLLTQQMAEKLNISKPYCVMEGIATVEEDAASANQADNIKTVFYSGTLHRKFGILTLLEAFRKIDNPDYRLLLCGVGDCEEEIWKAAGEDSRIHFLGQLPREKVLQLQREATVLVNPRQNNEEFTKYSFPSKILEYLSAGVPVVAYELDGMPDEYRKYISYVSDNSSEALRDRIVGVCELPEEKRNELGRKGREFVTTEKNSNIQAKKILKLIEGL